MSENFNHSDKIDAYFNQAMNEGQKRLFEQQVVQDPLLRAEFDLQKDIVDALKDTRRAELKSRLEAIPNPGTGLVSLPTQIIGGVLVAGAALFAGYFMLSETAEDQDRQLIQLTEQNVLAFTQEYIPEKPLVKLVPEDKQSSESQATEVDAANQPIATENPDIQKASADTPANTVTETVTEASANIDLPNLIDDEDSAGEGLEATRVELPESGLDPLEEDLTENVEIEHISTEGDALTYRFYNSKLYLYGSFGEVPYEILEINSRKGKSYYLYHNEAYYKLSYNQIDPAPLKSITNKRVVRELDIIRKNK